MPKSENAYERTLRLLADFNKKVCTQEDQDITLYVASNGCGELRYSSELVNEQPIFQFNSLDTLVEFFDLNFAAQMYFCARSKF